jgi:hypothetical protein
MTLQSWLTLQQDQTEHVLRVNTIHEFNSTTRQLEAKPVFLEEIHPVSAEILPLLQRLWTETYQRFQQRPPRRRGKAIRKYNERSHAQDTWLRRF